MCIIVFINFHKLIIAAPKTLRLRLQVNKISLRDCK